MASDYSSSLNRLLAQQKAEIEAEGIVITGWGGKSREGPVWHYDFAHTWLVPPDNAVVRISTWWASYCDTESDDVTLTRFAEIFREGQVSSFKDVRDTQMKVSQILEGGLLVPLREAIADGIGLIEQRLGGKPRT